MNGRITTEQRYTMSNNMIDYLKSTDNLELRLIKLICIDLLKKRGEEE